MSPQFSLVGMLKVGSLAYLILLLAACTTPPTTKDTIEGAASRRPEQVKLEDVDIAISRGRLEANYSVQRVHFATDRAPTGRQEPSKYFGGQQGEISYGICDVSIPRDHRMGELESPSIWRLEFREDPNKHVVLENIQPQESNVFFDELKSRLLASKGKKAFVFIHGFNVGFADAARRTAQISYDLGFDGVPIFYSWPSQNQLFQYGRDEKNAAFTEPHLKSFFAELSTHLDADEIYVIAHSMGNRPTSQALASLFSERPELASKFKEIILMAPDIDANVFKADIAPRLMSPGRHVTLYSSSNDMALKISKMINGGQRLGDSTPSIVVFPGIESIDVSDVSTDLIGHSYYGDARSVLSDLMEVVQDKGSASGRSHLTEILDSMGRFWRFMPPSAKVPTSVQ